jgi:hypothetical protein
VRCRLPLRFLGSSTFIMGNDCHIRFSTRHFWSGSIVLWRQSARGLAHCSKTLRAVRVRSVHAQASWSAAALRRFGTSTRVISLRTRPRPPQPSFRILQCCRLPRCSGMNVQSRLYPLKMSRNQLITNCPIYFFRLGFFLADFEDVDGLVPSVRVRIVAILCQVTFFQKAAFSRDSKSNRLPTQTKPSKLN